MNSLINLLSLLILVILCYHQIRCNPDAKRLYDDLMSSYNRLIRPVVNNSDKLTVKMGLKLSQLIDVNLKQQFMTTNIWLEQNWYDYNLKWDPSNYQGVDMIHVPAEHIWLPDIVLFNNYDGNYEVTLMTKARVYYTGLVSWNPPALYKSTCKIDVEYFPFDEQSCLMKFGSWTYDGLEVDLRHFQQEEGSDYVDIGIDMSECVKSVEWDILLVPAKYNEQYYDCCTEPYPDITFNITTRRKTLFYTVNLIIPCVGITLLTVLVFYLPSDSGEKVTLSISILVSLTVFFLLLAETIPPTSLAVPLLGKYLIFTMMLITTSICVTVGVLNVHFRSSSTHKMPEWVRTLFIHMLPKFLMMKRPSFHDWNEEIAAVGLNMKSNFRCYNGESNGMSLRRESYKQIQKNGNNGSFRVDPLSCYSESSRPTMPPLVPHFVANLDNDIPGLSMMSDFTDNQHFNDINTEFGSNKTNYCNNENHINWSNDKERIASNQQLLNSSFQFSPEVHKAIESILFIADHIRKDDEENNVIQDWKYVAMVLDRLFLWIFTLACFCGTCGIILQAPSLYDQRTAIDLQIFRDLSH